jgi:hypothetical protein
MTFHSVEAKLGGGKLAGDVGRLIAVEYSGRIGGGQCGSRLVEIVPERLAGSLLGSSHASALR